MEKFLLEGSPVKRKPERQEDGVVLQVWYRLIIIDDALWYVE